VLTETIPVKPSHTSKSDPIPETLITYQQRTIQLSSNSKKSTNQVTANMTDASPMFNFNPNSNQSSTRLRTNSDFNSSKKLMYNQDY